MTTTIYDSLLWREAQGIVIAAGRPISLPQQDLSWRRSKRHTVYMGRQDAASAGSTVETSSEWPMNSKKDFSFFKSLELWNTVLSQHEVHPSIGGGIRDRKKVDPGF